MASAQPQPRTARLQQILFGTVGQLIMLFSLALALRLLVWRWYEFYPLTGDEQEYLNQALTMLRERRYDELRLMRPPLYGVFLAANIYFFDSLIQNLRLVQAVISAATVVPIYMLTREISDGRLAISTANTNHQSPIANRQSPFLAALLCALSYTLAANATELLTETLFVFGLAVFFALLLWAGKRLNAEPQSRRDAAEFPVSSSQPKSASDKLRNTNYGLRSTTHLVTLSSGHLVTFLAGLVLGLLALTRSAALPLLPLGVLWLLGLLSLHFWRAGNHVKLQQLRLRMVPALLVVLGALLVVLPWTARNYATYGALIIIDTTGAENLWLDNNPHPGGWEGGREEVKAQLYALGNDMAARQRLASQQGLANITGNPQWFANKAWGELLQFFALEHADDMRDRPAIWLPPAQVWTRLILGDGLWLLLLLAGTYGLVRVTSYELRVTSEQTPFIAHRSSFIVSVGLLFGLWAAYTLLTTLIFHVELRYRLPLYPVLLPFAALALVGQSPQAAAGPAEARRWPKVLALLLPAACLLLTLLHRPYPLLAWQLGWKHWHLAQAEGAAARGDAAATREAARAALANDERSVLARVALARADLLVGNESAAETTLREAIGVLRAHPHPHLLLGDMLRQRGDAENARSELAYERNSLEDMQTWSWNRFRTPPPPALTLGNGLDLGFIQGFHLVQEGEQGRWTTDSARVRLSLPPGATSLALRLASGRPAGATPVPLAVLVNGQPVGNLQVTPKWADYRLPLPDGLTGDVIAIELRSPTFRPRDLNRASPDSRQLGMQVEQISLQP